MCITQSSRGARTSAVPRSFCPMTAASDRSPPTGRRPLPERITPQFIYLFIFRNMNSERLSEMSHPDILSNN